MDKYNSACDLLATAFMHHQQQGDALKEALDLLNGLRDKVDEALGCISPEITDDEEDDAPEK